MLFRGDLQGEPKPAGRMGHAHKVSFRESAWPMRSRIFPPPGAACLSLAVPERTRRTTEIDTVLPARIKL